MGAPECARVPSRTVRLYSRPHDPDAAAVDRVLTEQKNGVLGFGRALKPPLPTASERTRADDERPPPTSRRVSIDERLSHGGGVPAHAAFPHHRPRSAQPRASQYQMPAFRPQSGASGLLRPPHTAAALAAMAAGGEYGRLAQEAAAKAPATDRFASKQDRERLVRNLRQQQLRRLLPEGTCVRPSTSAGSVSSAGMPNGGVAMYRQERVLGKGAFGVVSLVRSVLTGEAVAMKTIDRSKLHSENAKKTVEHEIRILKRLKHGNIVRLLEVIETSRTIHLVLEYIDGGSVQQLLKSQGKIDEPKAQRILWQLLDAVDYCHQNYVCHRDLKLENFMLDRSHRRLTLIDFGLSVIWRAGQQLFKSYGTPCYMAPEILRGQHYSGPNVDIWSLGVSLACMLMGHLPFNGHVDGELKRRIMRGTFVLPDHISDEGRDLLRQMLTTKPELRIGIHGIRQHAWMRLPASDPSLRRTGSTEVKEPAALEAEVMRRLEGMGFEAAVVERSVAAPLYNHEHACYQMVRAAVMRERDGGA
ncbi:hypothetical protein AB1Y20_004839 [Prymnesium parvum]|uniref:Protein kinase domain-containing protein n=1 Tax=Prymnesium parvum TaxID=97485 RepID=A0AB34J0E1_PRYPA